MMTSAVAAGGLLERRQHAYRSLAAVFVAWKAALLAIAVLASCAGPAYDTSADLLEAAGAGVDAYWPRAPGHAIPSGGVVSRLSSWDAIYFVQVARRGYLYEQEWAFGAGLPTAVVLLQRALTTLGLTPPVPVALLAVAYAHAAHLLAVFVLYKLGCLVWHGDGGRTVAYLGACLHILSPAGLFLSAPYAESSCAFFSFAGYLAFAAARRNDASSRPALPGDLLCLAAGLSFGVATFFRSNGLLNGLLFVYEAATGAVQFLRQPSLPLLRRLIFVGLGGLLVGAGSVLPQAVAYRQFCLEPSGVPGEEFRPWCTALLPSIYTFVQSHYWGTGFLQYWTLSNLPLFLLATPMLLVLAYSAADTWSIVAATPMLAQKAQEKSNPVATAVKDSLPSIQQIPLLQCIAAIQLILAVLALTSYHVQIISRLSSAYPVWYWWLAQGLAGGPRSKIAGMFVAFMVMYASIQGILFASFLPPA